MSKDTLTEANVDRVLKQLEADERRKMWRWKWSQAHDLRMESRNGGTNVKPGEGSEAVAC